MDDNPGDWQPDGTGTYVGEETTISYDVEGGQHVEINGNDT